MAAALALLAILAALALGVSAETHHIVGGWGPDFNATAWLLGRFFTVGDKLRTCPLHASSFLYSFFVYLLKLHSICFDFVLNYFIMEYLYEMLSDV